MARDWQTQTKLINKLLAEMVVDQRAREMKPDKGFETLANLMTDVRRDCNRVYLVGNGPSASLASEFAVDLARKGHLLTEMFSESAQMSAVANDMGYEWIFAEPLRRRGKKGDMLVCISTSGRSINVLKAEDVANRLGIHTVTLSACEPENPLRRAGELNFYVAAKSRGDAHACFQSIMNHAVNQIKLDESKTVEIKYHELFAEMGRPGSEDSSCDPDSAFFLP